MAILFRKLVTYKITLYVRRSSETLKLHSYLEKKTSTYFTFHGFISKQLGKQLKEFIHIAV